MTILVCTHNDADHAEGVIGFLESGLRCHELWLPATWLDALQSLPRRVEDTLHAVWERFYMLTPQWFVDDVSDGEHVVLEMAWQAMFPNFQEMSSSQLIEQQRRKYYRGRGTVSMSDMLGDVIDSLNKHLDALSSSFEWPFGGAFGWPFEYSDPRDRWARCILNDTERLLRLARLALDLGIPIRCLRHDPQNANGVPGYPLRPLSARSVRYVRPPAARRGPDEFFALAALTVTNKESLVCYLDGEDWGCGVLFTADSNLDGIDLSRIHPLDIATAPHHGSADNRGAYARIGKPMIWVRSDGYSKRRPCEEYLKALGQRFCTLCRNSSRGKQAVRLYTWGGQWEPRGSRRCQCG
ncbi:MAG: hypothetical protein RMJ46_00930 [Bacteroidota bacterium]|nr:hypothetical protein [Bacteroidota bacterium]